ncbi:SRPBCC family protein [Salegentibacter sp. HM20]
MSLNIKKEIRINNGGGKVFKALITPTSIQKWWGASQVIVVADENGTFAATWGEDIDKPEYTSTAKISHFEPHTRLKLKDFTYLRLNEYLPFKAKFEIDFKIECYNSYCVLVVTHSGFPRGPEADEYYTSAGKGWDRALQAIKDLVGEKPKAW